MAEEMTITMPEGDSLHPLDGSTPVVSNELAEPMSEHPNRPPPSFTAPKDPKKKSTAQMNIIKLWIVQLFGLVYKNIDLTLHARVSTICYLIVMPMFSFLVVVLARVITMDAITPNTETGSFGAIPFYDHNNQGDQCFMFPDQTCSFRRALDSVTRETWQEFQYLSYPPSWYPYNMPVTSSDPAIRNLLGYSLANGTSAGVLARLPKAVENGMANGTHVPSFNPTAPAEFDDSIGETLFWIQQKYFEDRSFYDFVSINDTGFTNNGFGGWDVKQLELDTDGTISGLSIDIYYPPQSIFLSPILPQRAFPYQLNLLYMMSLNDSIYAKFPTQAWEDRACLYGFSMCDDNTTVTDYGLDEFAMIDISVNYFQKALVIIEFASAAMAPAFLMMIPLLVADLVYEQSSGILELMVQSGMLPGVYFVSHAIVFSIKYGILLTASAIVLLIASTDYMHPIYVPFILALGPAVFTFAMVISQIIRSPRFIHPVIFTTLAFLFPLMLVINAIFYPDDFSLPWYLHMFLPITVSRFMHAVGWRIIDNTRGFSVLSWAEPWAVITMLAAHTAANVLVYVALKMTIQGRTKRLAVSALYIITHPLHGLLARLTAKSDATVDADYAIVKPDSAADPATGSITAHDHTKIVDDMARLVFPSPEGDRAVCEISDVRQTFRMINGTRVAALRGLSFDILDGEALVLLGANGAGKSTLINILSGLTRPSSGHVHFSSTSTVGLCPQTNVHYSSLSVLSNLRIFGYLKGKYGRSLRESIDSNLDDLDLRVHRKKAAHTLSGGMQRRLGIGMALVGEPALCLLDEPTSGLDIATSMELQETLLDMKQKRTMLITTHSMAEADYLADRIAFLAHGQLAAIGTPSQLKASVECGYVIRVQSGLGLEDVARSFVLETIPDAQHLSTDFGSLLFKAAISDRMPLSQIYERLEDGIAQSGIRDWEISDSSLDDLFDAVGKI
ncbi:ABC transporter [Carpediemonas membranifera]|uniref:ABC transporter n=1 Tax=Carpediemonas membranifera TaxID=201153 RepID=A0A8J6E4D7_9EUKA|nr:ABC transporter [Carpediemonas membranifera]|eukprot:KAG9397073.1 ABC transporter [Carpediemonas membranifera]